MAKLLGWQWLLLCGISNLVVGERIKDMIYMPLGGAAACFRRHNGTHQFGCSSSRSGSVGVVHIVEIEDDVEWLETKATAGPYTVVMPFSMFTSENLLRLRKTNNINGVLLARNVSHDYPDSYSPDDSCPNRYSSYKKCNDAKPWNPFGSSLLMEDWPFPMFYIENQTLLEAIKTCFWTHNAHDLETQSERSLCALEMKSFMYAALNSKSCIQRSEKLTFNPTPFCDPLGDRNVHWPLAPLKENDTNTVIMVVARLDASSLFEGISPGAKSTVTGLVTLLATAHYLNSLSPTVEKTNVVFTLLNGESFDYIGSSRLVYDLKEGNFNSLGGVNLKLDDVKSVIELTQLDSSDIFLHISNEDQNELVTRLKKKLNATISNDIPPVSVQSFLQARNNLSAIVIANYNNEFKNKYYNSILDDEKSIHFNRNETNGLANNLAKIAIHLAETLYENVMGFDAPPGTDVETEKLIKDMLYCYLQSANCDLFHAASSPGSKLTDQVLPLYVGVHRMLNPATSLTGLLLALLTGEKLPELNEATCYERHLAWMGGDNFTGMCINSTVNYSTAMSPAFIIDGYDMQSGVFSTWTESIWQTLSVRMFLKPSPAAERLSMIIGSIVASLSFVLVWFINSRSDKLFNSRRPEDC